MRRVLYQLSYLRESKFAKTDSNRRPPVIDECYRYTTHSFGFGGSFDRPTPVDRLTVPPQWIVLGIEPRLGLSFWPVLPLHYTIILIQGESGI